MRGPAPTKKRVTVAFVERLGRFLVAFSEGECRCKLFNVIVAVKATVDTSLEMEKFFKTRPSTLVFDPLVHIELVGDAGVFIVDVSVTADQFGAGSFGCDFALLTNIAAGKGTQPKYYGREFSSNSHRLDGYSCNPKQARSLQGSEQWRSGLSTASSDKRERSAAGLWGEEQEFISGDEWCGVCAPISRVAKRPQHRIERQAREERSRIVG